MERDTWIRICKRGKKQKMIIREILEADWNIDTLNITVRDKKTTKYIMRYCIGKDVKAGKSEKFMYESKCGNVYGNAGMNTLYMDKIIQHFQLKNLPLSKIGLKGVLTEKVPKELLELSVIQMSPYCRGNADGLHGYYFECYVDNWGGIAGENKQIEMVLEND